MKWFNENVKTVDELRKVYKKLLVSHHPDNGGNVSSMQEINVEYDYLFKRVQHEDAKYNDFNEK